MKLKSITFTLENCDTITIPGTLIGDFIADDIRTSIHRIACNAINRCDTCYKFFIEIHSSANIPHLPFGQSDLTISTFSRLSESDITAIEFELTDAYPEDGDIPATEHYSCYLDWTGDSDYINKAQWSYTSKLGNLYIFVSANEQLTDYVDMEEINDPMYMKFKFKMYGIEEDSK